MTQEAEPSQLPAGVQRLISALGAHGLPYRPFSPDAVPQAEAASPGPSGPGRFARSILFRRKPDDAAVLVIMPGDRKVDTAKLAQQVCRETQRVVRADAAFVRSRTGFDVEHLPPAPHPPAIVTLLDASLFRFDRVWVSAGQARAVIPLRVEQLQRLTSAPAVDLAIDPDTARASLRHAAGLMLARASAISPSDDRVPSPCVSVCRVDADSGMCEGCFRTLREISGWSRAGPDAQRALWKSIVLRVQAVSG